MASRRTRKTTLRRRPVATRKRAARKAARPAKPRTPKKRAKAKPAKPATLFFFWPVLLINRITRRLPAFLRYPVRAGGYFSLIVLALFVTGAAFYFLRSLRYDMAKVAEMPERSIIFDRSENKLGHLHGTHRYVVKLDEVSPHFIKALLAREDKNFQDHPGVDPRGVIRAFYQNFKRGHMAQGASTLTMQLARNAYNLPNSGPWWKQLDRKFLELALALRIEKAYEKDQILEHYVNLIFWGGSIHGVEAASRAYFEKSAKDLSLSESAMLAGIIRAPNAFSPFDDIEVPKGERDDTLNAMVKYELITEAEAEAAKKEELHIRPPHRRMGHGSYAMDAIRRDIEEFLEKKNIKQGGLKIITTIDGSLQHSAELNLDKWIRRIERRPGYHHQTRSGWQAKPAGARGAPAYLQGAVVVIENETGAIRAIVGGRNADESKFNRALHAKRQIGSVFKPFVFLSAFNRGLRPHTWISDDRIRPGEIKNAPGDWSPKNSDGKYLKTVTVKDALIKSRNTSSVRVGNFAGLENVARVAHQAFAREMPLQPSSYLGSWQATPKEVASAYTIFPNGGKRYRPFLISKILDSDGNVVYETPLLFYEAAKRGAAWDANQLLEGVTKTGTASAMRRTYDFQKPAGGKTGTTNNFQDAWFVGYSSSLTCAVWVGFDTPKRIAPDGYGAVMALPVWVDVMNTADRLQRYQFREIKAPIEVKTCRLCRSTGKWATPGCERARSAYNDRAPLDLAPAEGDYCPAHPLRAQPVAPAPRPRPVIPRAQPVDPIPRARPVPSNPPPRRAIPVD